MTQNSFRKNEAEQIRIHAAQLAASRPHPRHQNNGEEYEYRFLPPENADGGPEVIDSPSHIANFTKGLPHDVDTGLLKNPLDYQQFVRGIDSGDVRDFADTPLGPAAPGHTAGCLSKTAIDCDTDLAAVPRPWQSDIANFGTFDSTDTCDTKAVSIRAWESAGAGLTFDLEGPDSQSVTMPPAPRIDSPELAAEMCEVYCQALLRDVHVSNLREPIGPNPGSKTFGLSNEGCRRNGHCDTSKINDQEFDVPTAIHLLALQEEWFGLAETPQPAKVVLPRSNNNDSVRAPACLTDAEYRRLRPTPTQQSIFRGIAPGDQHGPYISQFMLIGNTGLNSNDTSRGIADGLISYGAITVNQRVRIATPCRDYMTTFAEYIDVQNGARLQGLESYVDTQCQEPKLGNMPGYRFITTPRDLATYVHYDALYESYLNACLLMLGLGIPFDRGLPFARNDVADHQQGFAQFGGPHILTLVTEVATRALKAVRYQKFNVHRRLRPEALAGLISKYPEKKDSNSAFGPVRSIYERLSRTSDQSTSSILDWVSAHNRHQNQLRGIHEDYPLLPMAFVEGSPMHPSYGAGHATVAGACVTILKAFFDVGTELWEVIPWGPDDKEARPICYEPSADGCGLISLLSKQAPEHAINEKTYANFGQSSPQQSSHPATSLRGVKRGSYDFQPLTVEGELNKLAANISIGRDWAGVHYFTDYIESLRLGESIAIGLLEEQKLTYRENFSMTVPLFDGGAVRI